MFKTTLTLDALEAREVPAFIGLVKGGPQPEPPTVVGTTAVVADAGYAKWAMPPFAVGGKTGILLPSLSPAAPTPAAAAPNGILFPVFVGR